MSRAGQRGEDGDLRSKLENITSIVAIPHLNCLDQGMEQDVISQVRAAHDRAQPSTLAWHRKSSWNNATSHKLSTLPEKQRKCSPGSAASLLASVSFLHVSLLAGP